jgi:hypothetical protein
VGDCNDQHVAAVDSIKDRVRETPQYSSADISSYFETGGRRFCDKTTKSSYTERDFVSRTWMLGSVKGDASLKIIFRLRW